MVPFSRNQRIVLPCREIFLSAACPAFRSAYRPLHPAGAIFPEVEVHSAVVSSCLETDGEKHAFACIRIYFAYINIVFDGEHVRQPGLPVFHQRPHRTESVVGESYYLASGE